MKYNPQLAKDNPYNAHRNYDPTGFWYGEFVKAGAAVWIVFLGDRFLAEVKNAQQCENLMEFLHEHES
jgi:hypothetical protein